ncbi:sterol desaturase family protein [Parasphingorhabdus halotolerans]|uniref:Sterol desaturase family protein n=1 Tax=Parasphingorhabdus halotolerans TaxID=2725558 RepID=A0A6H2DL77_9SPHN|nr:sterol desaturase family protein [Parasphingorhabdus halotolerans]QJB69140.1 sterol desaturase family protein [Parasphingorhabdus halotolerans]
MVFFEHYETIIRFAILTGVFAAMAGLELAFPRRSLSQPKAHRWFTNIGMVIIDTALLRVAMPLLMIGAAEIAFQRQWGLLAFTELPVWMEFLVAILLLDLAIYIQHVATHKIPLLWDMHKVHHADRDFDVTTAVRFHPFEIFLSMVYKIACVFVIGPSVLAVFALEVLLSASAMFNHSNVKIPLKLDQWLRWFIVTPDMHRVHHSIIRAETDSNYGFFLTIWDRIFGTYIDQPQLGHEGMTIGLAEYQTEEPSGLGWSLLLPLQRSRSAKINADHIR